MIIYNKELIMKYLESSIGLVLKAEEKESTNNEMIININPDLIGGEYGLLVTKKLSKNLSDLFCIPEMVPYKVSIYKYPFSHNRDKTFIEKYVLESMEDVDNSTLICETHVFADGEKYSYRKNEDWIQLVDIVFKVLDRMQRDEI